VHAAWVYHVDGTKLHHVNNSTELADDVPVPKEEFPTLFGKDGRCHFFAVVRDVVIEYRGTTIHPSRDATRETPTNGYFFAARLWNKPVLEEMAMYTGNDTVSLVMPVTRAGEDYNDEYNGLMAFSPRTLSTWDKKPLAQLVVRNDSPIVRQLSRSSRRLLLWLMLFAVVLLLLLSSSLVRWVSRPLRHIMETLKRNDPSPIARLSKDNSEFGELARTVQKFFDQRDNLIREMDERRATEEALRKSEEELRHSRRWKPSDGWRAASPTTSTISSRRSSATPS
jgi:hypothetical protein